MRVEVELSAAGVEPSRAAGELRMLSAGARLRRVGAGLVASVLCAALLIPIPIVHLIGIPLVLLIGIGWAVRVSRSVAVLSPIRIPCPRCGAANALGGGLGLRTTTGPLQLTCESCRRVLVLTLDAVLRGAETSTPTRA